MILTPLVVTVFVLGGAYYFGTQGGTPKKGKTTAEYRREEIKNLELMLHGDLAQARREGKSDAELEIIRAKYQSSIDRLKAEDKEEVP